MAPFDFENCAKASNGFTEEVKDLVEEVSNLTMHQRAFRNLGIDQNLLPVSALKKEVLVEANKVLISIKL